jgi:DNA polymerase-3 subunit beta
MKVTILQDVLSKALSIVGRAVATRSTLPVLGNIRIESRDGMLYMASTNLEIGITLSVPAHVDEPGATTLPARLLTEFVNSLPVAQRVSITLNEKTQTTRLTCAGYDANIKGIDAKDFPNVGGKRSEDENSEDENSEDEDAEEVPILDGNFITVDGNELKRMIDLVAFAAATDESRPTLTGVEVTMADVIGHRRTVPRLSGHHPEKRNHHGDRQS